MTDISGQKCLELSRNVNLLGLLRKMCLELWPWNSTISSLTWNVKITSAKRLLFQLVPRTRHIDESGYGLLPTPCASDAQLGSILSPKDSYRLTKNGSWRHIKASGITCSLTLGRLFRLKTGFYLMPEVVEEMMGYPIGWTE